MTDPAAAGDKQLPVTEPPVLGTAQRLLYHTLSRALLRVTRLHRLALRQTDGTTHLPTGSEKGHD